MDTILRTPHQVAPGCQYHLKLQSSVEKIPKNFLQQIIPLIIGKPTYTVIRAVHHLLQENATSVLTVRDIRDT
eukprot:14931224-Ditylum_brightwellii.AAC.1